MLGLTGASRAKTYIWINWSAAFNSTELGEMETVRGKTPALSSCCLGQEEEEGLIETKRQHPGEEEETQESIARSERREISRIFTEVTSKLYSV